MAGSAATAGMPVMNLQRDRNGDDARQAFCTFDMRHAVAAPESEEVLILDGKIFQSQTGVFIGLAANDAGGSGWGRARVRMDPNQHGRKDRR